MTTSHLFCLLCLGRFFLWVGAAIVGALILWYALMLILGLLSFITGSEEREE